MPAGEGENKGSSDTNYFVVLSVWGTIRRVFRIFYDHYGLFLVISGTIALVSAVLVFLSVLVLIKPLFELYEEDEVLNSYEFFQFPSGEAMVTFAVDMLLFYALICVADGAIVQAVTEIYVDKSPTASSVLALATQKPMQLIGSAIVVGIPYFFVFASLFLPQTSNWATVIVLLIIFALSIHLMTYPVYPAIMVEPSHTVLSAIQRSFQLTSGNISYVMCILFLMWAGKTIAQLPSYFLESSTENGFVLLLSKAVSVSITMVFASLNSMYVATEPNSTTLIVHFCCFSDGYYCTQNRCQAVVYLNLRIVQEGLNFETLALEIGAHQAEYVNVKAGDNADTTAVELGQMV